MTSDDAKTWDPEGAQARVRANADQIIAEILSKALTPGGRWQRVYSPRKPRPAPEGPLTARDEARRLRDEWLAGMVSATH